MKLAYLTSLYPAVSHTFVLREVLALRARGHEVGTFSIRRPRAHDIRGEQARQEAAQTRWLVPGNVLSYYQAFAWLARRAGSLKVWKLAQSDLDLTFRDRVMSALYFSEAVQLAHWLVKERFEHLHCHLGNAGSSTALLAAALAGLPFSLTCHGAEMYERQTLQLARKVEHAAFVVCVSELGKRHLMQLTTPNQWSKLQVVRCGLEKIDASPMPIHDGPGRLLCVARLSAEKGHALLLSALSELQQRGHAFHCTLVGDGPLRPAIEAQIVKLGLSAQVSLTGSLAPEHVAEHYIASDIVVLASAIEGVPVALMEAMAHGRPVVATGVGGVRELVVHEQTGFVVRPGDAHALAAALATFLSSRSRAADAGRAGSELVWQEFSLPHAAERLEALFLAASCTQVDASRTARTRVLR